MVVAGSVSWDAKRVQVSPRRGSGASGDVQDGVAEGDLDRGVAGREGERQHAGGSRRPRRAERR